MIDLIGIDNIVKYIEQSGKTKFSIWKQGTTNNAIPVFECLEHDTKGNALQIFRRWAELITNSNVYRIQLMDEVQINEDQKITRKGGRNGRCEATFAINPPAPSYNSTEKGPAFNAESLRADIVRELNQKQEESAVLKAMQEMRTEIAALKLAKEAEEEEEEEEEEEGIAGLSPAKMGQIAALINMFKGTAPAGNPVNGPVEYGQETKTDRINRALKILYKHDKEIDTDLLKLAEMAEKNNAMFNTMLSTLRSM